MKKQSAWSGIGSAKLVEELNARIAVHDLTGAEHYCRQWLNKNTSSDKSWVGHFMLAFILQKSERLTDSLEIYHKCISLNPGHLQTRLNLAAVLDALNHHEKAITENKLTLQLIEAQAIPSSKELIIVLNALAYRLTAQGRYAEAEEYYYRSLALDPSQKFILDILPKIRGTLLAKRPAPPTPEQPDVPAKIYQIFYDEKTRQSIDPRFTPLDNTHNPRPDWREYWPIRNFLLQHHLEEGIFYGFLSPRFREKTDLSGTQVLDFIRTSQGEFDVIGFSPFFDNIALFLHAFEQGEFHHPGLLDVAVKFFLHIDESIPVPPGGALSGNTVFCNYFVAKAPFWRKWLELCEKLFDVCETNQEAFAQDLNAATGYKNQGVHTKVFVMERLVNVLLAKGEFSYLPYPPLQLPISTGMTRYPKKLAELETYKLIGARTNAKEWEKYFLQKRQAFLDELKSTNTTAPALIDTHELNRPGFTGHG